MSAFLSTLDAAERLEVELLFRRQIYADGATLFQQGEPATGGYLIRQGRVALELTLPGAERLRVSELGPGAFFGEPSLLLDGTRTLSARAVGELHVDLLERHDFQGLRHSLRPAAFKVMLELARLTGQRIQLADQATSGQPLLPAQPTPAQPLSASGTPGCSFDPRPFLGRLPFFSAFSPTEREELLALGELYELPRGSEVLRGGQRSDCCFSVVRGAVEVVNPVTHQHMAVLGPGSLFGHLAPLLGARTIADCRTRERAVLLELGPEALEILLRPERRVSHRFVNALCVALLRGLARADRVLARTEHLRKLSG